MEFIPYIVVVFVIGVWQMNFETQLHSGKVIWHAGGSVVTRNHDQLARKGDIPRHMRETLFLRHFFFSHEGVFLSFIEARRISHQLYFDNQLAWQCLFTDPPLFKSRPQTNPFDTPG